MSSSRKIFLFIALPLLVAFAGVAAYLMISAEPKLDTEEKMSADVKAKCSPMQLQTPTDVSLVTSVLYPGQVRGGDYKPHGGFRFDGLKNENVIVKAPYDASLFAGSRYIEQGEVQYMFDFMTDCGVNFRFDHLKTLSPKLQALAETLPEAKVDDSRTSNIRAGTGGDVKIGETIATAVGFTKGDNGPNVSFDFGVYDKRQKNESSRDATWLAAHQEDGDQAIYAVCWLEMLPDAESAILKDLPSSNSTNGKTSDYCKL